MRRTREVNRLLLGSRVLRPLYLSSWVPNGLIVGCEALFIPFAGERAGYLLAATAAGMLAGDVVVGRFLPHHVRDRLVNPLRFLLAVPFLAFWFHPSIGGGDGLGLVAAIGYADSLPLQERMVAHTPDDSLGQMLGLRAAGLRAGQASVRCSPAPPPTCSGSDRRPPAGRWRSWPPPRSWSACRSCRGCAGHGPTAGRDYSDASASLNVADGRITAAAFSGSGRK